MDLEFLKKEKLENLGCIGLFDVGDEVCPQLVHLFYANLEKGEPKGRGRTYYTIKMKDTIITCNTVSIKKILNLNLDPSEVFPSMLAAKACKLCFEKYAHPSKIRNIKLILHSLVL